MQCFGGDDGGVQIEHQMNYPPILLERSAGWMVAESDNFRFFVIGGPSPTHANQAYVLSK